MTLVILLLLQLTAMTVVSSVNITYQVLINHQKIQGLYRDADNLINYLITNKDYFLNYSDYINADGKFEIAIPDFIVALPRSGKITQFECTNCPYGLPILKSGNQTALGNTYWVLNIEISDIKIGSAVAVEQGLTVKVKANSGSIADHAAWAMHSGQSLETLQLIVQGSWWYSQLISINRRE